jgi:iron complex outermembrane receptor protein
MFRPTVRDTLQASVEYLHSRYDSFAFEVYNRSLGPFINSYPPEATGCVLGLAVPYTANDANPGLRGDSTQRIDCSGKPLVRAPRWSGTVSYEHVFDLGDKQLITGVDGQFASSQYISSDFIGSGRDDGFLLLNAHATLRLHEKLRLTAWARNLSREAIYTSGIRYNFSRPRAAGGDPTLFYAQIGAPRTFGASLDVDF